MKHEKMEFEKKITEFSQNTFDGFLDVIQEEIGDIDEYDLGRLIGKFFVLSKKYEALEDG